MQNQALASQVSDPMIFTDCMEIVRPCGHVHNYEIKKSPFDPKVLLHPEDT